MSKYQVNDHSVLKVTKEEAQQGKSWHDIARRRAQSQHGDDHADPTKYPEGDIHRVNTFDTSIHMPQTNHEEAAAAITSLEEKLKQMQGEQERLRQQHIEEQQKKTEDDPYKDDWYK